MVEGVEGLLEDGGGGVWGRWMAGRRGEVCFGGEDGGFIGLIVLVGWSRVDFAVFT